MAAYSPAMTKRYYFQAALHYDLAALKEVSLSEDDLGSRREHTDVTLISVADYNQRLRSDQVDTFRRGAISIAFRLPFRSPCGWESRRWVFSI